MRRLPVVASDTADDSVAPAVVTQAPPAARFRVEGMDCAACARTVERVVSGLDGVERVEVAFGAGTLRVWGTPTDERVAGAVASAGYRATPYDPRRRTGRTRWSRDARALSAALGLAVLVTAVVLDLAVADQRVADAAYLLSMAIAGWPIGRAALAALRGRTLDMNVLMALAAIGAVAIGARAEGAWVLVLFAVGTLLEAIALDRARGSVEALAELSPETARVVDADGERVVDVDDVAVGSIIAIHPGERLPLDGVVVDGASSLDEAPITGESVPVDKATGDRLYAGSLNQHGALRVRTTTTAANSTVTRLVELVAEAQGSRAPSERLVERFARVYTPVVLVAAVLLAVVPVLFGGDASTWVYRGLALLIVACPCSLVISIPVAVVSAIGAAARNGVLIKGGAALEDLAAVRTVCVDKTGTLTRGVPALAETVPLGELDAREALRLAASVELRSEHPLAGALRQAAAADGLELREPSRTLALPGRGVDALLEGRVLWVGGPRLLEERAPAATARAKELAERGHTVIALGEQDRPLAVFAIADQVRPSARRAMDGLRAVGVERIVMLTGDNDAVARRVAAEAGVDAYEASLLPDDKLNAVRTERNAAMLGDGINDAPALAAARVGVAMGAAGSGIALDAADVALMSDELDRLPHAIGLAQRSLAVMRQNIVASLAVKGLLTLLAPFGLVSLWLAVAADMGMSLLVTANALRLLRHRPRG